MQVQVDSRQITQLEQNIEYLMGILRAVGKKHMDAKGVLRISQADLNASSDYTMEITPLKRGIKLVFEKGEREEE